MTRLKPFDEILERDVENVLVREVKKLGGTAEKFRTPGRRSAPDRIVMFEPGYVGFVECKRPGEFPTAKQADDHKRRRDMGFTVLVVDTKEKAKAAAQQLYNEAQECYW